MQLREKSLEARPLMARARLALDDVGEACSSIAREDDFWTYLKESGFILVHVRRPTSRAQVSRWTFANSALPSLTCPT